MRVAIAEIVAGLRVGARPRDPLSRVQWLVLLFGLANLVGTVPFVAVAPVPTALRAAAVAMVAMVSIAWTFAYRRRAFGAGPDLVTIAGIAAIAATLWTGLAETSFAVGPRPDAGVVFAAVLLTSLFGSTRHVVARGTALAGIFFLDVPAHPADLPLAAFLAIAAVVLAILMHALSTLVQGSAEGAQRERTMTSTGLALVAAADIQAIARATVESAFALCRATPGARVSLATAEGIGWSVDTPSAQPAGAPRTYFKVLAAAGERAHEIRGVLVDVWLFAASGPSGTLADQRLLRVDLPFSATCAAAGLPVIEGELLVTRVTVDGEARGLLMVEIPGQVADELPAAAGALAAQVSLAIARADVHKSAIERQNAERFQALVQNSTDVITIVTPDGEVRFQSPSAERVFGRRKEESPVTPSRAAPGLPEAVPAGSLTPEAAAPTAAASDVPERAVVDPAAPDVPAIVAAVHPDDAEKLAAAFRAAVAQPDQQVVAECRIRHSDGSWRRTETRITNMLDVPAVAGLVLNTRDVTERHSLEAELRFQAFHDSLTGLANRALFGDRVQQAVVHAQRDGSTLAVLFIDLDGFKRLNDSLGYAAGDAALIAVAERLRSCVRAPDTVGRLGGDEFGVLLDRLTSPADATLAVERIMGTLRQPLSLPGASVELQPYIGIAISIAGDDSPEDLLRNGAVAMHRAKTYDGGYTIYDPEMHADAIRRLEVESQLREAIDKGQIILHYQPTVELATGRLTGVEALVRWQHPRRGMVPPMEFIPLAEESGLIVPLGRWTIREACRQVRIWQQEIPADEPLCLSVNISARQLRHPNIVRDVADALDDTGLLPSRLILEITESVLMIDTAATLHKLFQLKSLGVRLAIDDFGTGYSSFSYLRRFPIDILKIDKSFVDGVATEPTASALVDAMIRIGKTLRMETVAEGVERAEQAERLRALQCDVGQGFLFSRPLGRDAITTFLRERSAQQLDQASAA